MGRLKKLLNIKFLHLPDNDHEVTCIKAYRIYNFPYHKNLHISVYTCFINLIEINLSCSSTTGDIINLKVLKNLNSLYFYHTDMFGDIEHLKSLSNLKEIVIAGTDITGDIVHFKSLHNLTVIILCDTSVYGDITHLKSLLNLIEINLNSTCVFGNIIHLKQLHKLAKFSFFNTHVTGDKKVFQDYRKKADLEECNIYI